MKKVYILFIIVLSSFQSKAQCLNLTQYTYPGWDNQILISAISGTSVSESAFYENQNLYLDFGVVNWGTCNTPRAFTVRLFLDGVEKYFTNVSSLQANYAQPFNDIAITGSLSVGSHTIQIDIDYPSLISETNESDNTFTRTFTVQQGACISTPIGTIWNGNRTFNTEHYLADNFRIKDKCQTAILTIRHWNSTTLTSNPLEIESPTNSWNSTGNQQWGGSTMWAAKSSYNYFSGVHSRNSYDGANGLLNGFIHGAFDNAGGTGNATMSFTGGIMKIGLGSSGTLANSYGTLDIVGHEYAHGVTGSSAQLAYQYDSGALNESFSDIFGECIENYTLGNNDWLLGANRTPAGSSRSMSNPNAYSQPDTYLGTNWIAQNCPSPTNNNDQCGVHTNSGVQNYWFYLLSQGGTGTNDLLNAFNVSALGIAKARDIAFKTLTIYLFNQPNAIYATARTASIQAAQDTYPGNSPEVSAVMNAWCAVGVGPVPGAVTVSGGGTFCTSTIITASSVMGANVYYQGTNYNGLSTAIPSTSQTITTSGTYYFRAQNGCGWGTAVGVTVTINPVPGAVSVSGGGTYCNSTTITASGGSGGSIYWQNTTNNGASAAILSSSQVINSSGTYYFRAYNSNCGFGPQGSATVTIQTMPAIVTVSGSGTFCNSTTITASGGVGGTIYYQGSTSNGTSFFSTSTSHVPTSSGTHYYRAYNTACLWGPQGSATVTINNVPSAVSVTGGGPSCNTATLSATGGTGGTIYWQGTNSGGESFASQSANMAVGTSNTYYFRAYNGCGWGTQGSATVTIQTVPAAVSVSGGGQTCNSSSTLLATGGSGGTIYWQNTTDAGISTSTPSTNQVVNSSNTYYFRSYNTACGFGPQGSATVSMITIPTAVNVSGTGTVCNSTTITASGGSGGTIYWQGTTSNGILTNTPSSSQPVSSSGIYYFRANNACGWGTQGSATVTIITALPTPVTVTGAGTFCLSKSIVASGGSGGTIYWQGTTNGGSSGATPSASQTVSSTGTYYFRAYNACGWGTQGSAAVVIIPNVLPLSGTATSSDQRAVQTISSTQIIPLGARVNYEAGKSISLQGTFNAQTGSVFKAEIKTCI